MRFFIAITDTDWYRHLSRLAARPGGLDEANFWKPSGKTSFKALSFGEPLAFKLRVADGDAIVGFGLFAAFRRLRVGEAWNVFGEANGASSRDEMVSRVFTHVQTLNSELGPLHHTVGCVLLAAPILFPEAMWIRKPGDWASSIQVGKGYDTTAGEGRRIWQACLDRAATIGQAIDIGVPTADPTSTVRQPGAHQPLFPVDPADRYGTERLIRHRLGQGTFRYALEQAYGRCAITGEHALPALDAAHIVPYNEGGEHALENGLLLRADLHRLYDGGYVTVTSDHRFRVSRHLREDFANGREYYDLEKRLDGKTIWTPRDPWPKPNPEFLERHATSRFLGA